MIHKLALKIQKMYNNGEVDTNNLHNRSLSREEKLLCKYIQVRNHYHYGCGESVNAAEEKALLAVSNRIRYEDKTPG